MREGIYDSRQDDYLPERFYNETLTKGPKAGVRMPKEKYDLMLDEYYVTRGWDKETGWPTRQKLEELSLKYVADDLERINRLGKINDRDKKMRFYNGRCHFERYSEGDY